MKVKYYSDYDTELSMPFNTEEELLKKERKAKAMMDILSELIMKDGRGNVVELIHLGLFFRMDYDEVGETLCNVHYLTYTDKKQLQAFNTLCSVAHFDEVLIEDYWPNNGNLLIRNKTGPIDKWELLEDVQAEWIDIMANFGQNIRFEEK